MSHSHSAMVVTVYMGRFRLPVLTKAAVCSCSVSHKTALRQKRLSFSKLWLMSFPHLYLQQ